MSNVAFNNFTSGIVTPKLAGNYNSNIYHNGCSKLENFSIMLQGGITRRPPLLASRNAHWGTNTAYRLIPFIVDVDNAYVVALGSSAFCMWKFNNTTKALDAVALNAGGTTFWGTTPFAISALPDIQYAQSADTLYLVHPSYRPQKIALNGGYYACSNVEATLTKYTDAQGNPATYDPMDEKESSVGNGDIFKTANNYPAVVGFLNNRLWFACSNNHPNRYWASRPFDHTHFWYYEMVRVENNTYSTEYVNAYITANDYDSTKTYALGDYCVHNGGLYKCTTAIATAEAWNADHWTAMTSSKTYTIRETVTEDCGIRFDASGNDAVRWISAKNNIIVGTASGEYAIPGSANGINYQLSDISSYGSQKGVQAVQANSEILYAQCGGKRIRSLTMGADGVSNIDLTYQCDRLIPEHGGIVRMAWRRVPDPTLYVVLGDGTMAVLFYDKNYGLCGWSHWVFKANATGTTNAKIKDVCVIDTADGQEVFMIVMRDETATNATVERLSPVDAAESINTSYKDRGTYPYVSEMVTNPYEYNVRNTGSSLGKAKRIRAFNCRVYQTKKLLAGYGEEKYMKGYSGSESFNDIEVLLPGGYQEFVQMTVRSVDDKPLTVLAFALDLEGER